MVAIEVLKEIDAEEKANPNPDTNADKRWSPPTTLKQFTKASVAFAE
jgi:hypothetical protein